MLWFERAIWGLPRKIEVNEFNIATRLSVPDGREGQSVVNTQRSLDHWNEEIKSVWQNSREALARKTRPVLDGVSHKSTVDIVKFLAIRPLGFNVVDFEADIRRHPTIGLEACQTASQDKEAYQRG